MNRAALLVCIAIGCGDDPAPMGPTVTSLTSDKAHLAPGETATITATIALPASDEMVATIASAGVYQAGNSIGTLAVDGANAMVFHVSLTWDQLVTPSTSGSRGGDAIEPLEARFVDSKGRMFASSIDMKLWCGSAAAGICRETCLPLDDLMDCGRCDNTCGEVTLEADPATTGGVLRTECDAPSPAALECGQLVYYQNNAPNAQPRRSCNDQCSAQMHGGQPMKCAANCGTTQGTIDYGNGNRVGEVTYLQQLESNLLAIDSCDVVPPATNGGLPINSTACCCIGQ